MQGYAVYDSEHEKTDYVRHTARRGDILAVDFHVHTCLSPCGRSDMIPPSIDGAAIRAGLDVIAITDHNASENVAAVASACEPELAVLGGMEITTAEEIHILAICADIDTLTALQREVYEHLPGENDAARFGDQYIVDSEGYIVGSNTHLLSGATDLGIDEVAKLIRRYGRLAIACHIDRMSFSVISQLGFVPNNLELDAIEVSKAAGEEYFEADRYPFPIITGSDAHEPCAVGASRTIFTPRPEVDRSPFQYIEAALKSMKNGCSGDAVRTYCVTN